MACLVRIVGNRHRAPGAQGVEPFSSLGEQFGGDARTRSDSETPPGTVPELRAGQSFSALPRKGVPLCHLGDTPVVQTRAGAALLPGSCDKPSPSLRAPGEYACIGGKCLPSGEKPVALRGCTPSGCSWSSSGTDHRPLGPAKRPGERCGRVRALQCPHRRSKSAHTRRSTVPPGLSQEAGATPVLRRPGRVHCLRDAAPASRSFSRSPQGHRPRGPQPPAAAGAL